jgi:outer membrane cobalamin receptor
MTAALRSTFGPRWLLTQRVAAVLNRYETEGFFGSDLQRASQKELSYRADMTFEPSEASVLKAGLQAYHGSGTLDVMGYGWTDPSHETIEMLRNDRYEGEAWRHGAYVSYRWRPSRSWAINPGVRADRFTLTGESTVSPWISVGWTPASKWEVTAGTGIYHQYSNLYQILGPTGGGRYLRAERTWHSDISIARQFNGQTRFVATAYTWEERDGIRRWNNEPRILDDELVWPNYTGQWYANALEGSSRGLELMMENNNPSGALYSVWPIHHDCCSILTSALAIRIDTCVFFDSLAAWVC